MTESPSQKFEQDIESKIREVRGETHHETGEDGEDMREHVEAEVY